MDANNVPIQLRDRPQWVVWRYEKRGGKPTKVPYNAARPNELASTGDSSTWATFDQAVSASGTADGIGYVFSEDDPYCGIDLDACIDRDGEMHPAALEIVERLDSYT